MLGSSFQKQHCTSAKRSRRRISAACARFGGLESGFTVDPWPTINKAALLKSVVIAYPDLNARFVSCHPAPRALRVDERRC
jgi:hypothetical protein